MTLLDFVKNSRISFSEEKKEKKKEEKKEKKALVMAGQPTPNVPPPRNRGLLRAY